VCRHEAGELRTIRLAALAADPDAFGSTYAREVGRPPAWWERWAADSDDGRDARTFVAIDAAGRWLGLALVRRDAAEPGTAVLHAMWVAPEARRRGAARALCDACAGWARASGCHMLTLGVAEGNDAALAAYRAAGFPSPARRRRRSHAARGGHASPPRAVSARLTPAPASMRIAGACDGQATRDVGTLGGRGGRRVRRPLHRRLLARDRGRPDRPRDPRPLRRQREPPERGRGVLPDRRGRSRPARVRHRHPQPDRVRRAGAAAAGRARVGERHRLGSAAPGRKRRLAGDRVRRPVGGLRGSTRTRAAWPRTPDCSSSRAVRAPRCSS
jgi:ribosomal protein S18 acetylase RimI-like enzyme